MSWLEELTLNSEDSNCLDRIVKLAIPLSTIPGHQLEILIEYVAGVAGSVKFSLIVKAVLATRFPAVILDTRMLLLPT